MWQAKAVPPEVGCKSIVHVATAPELDDSTGKYFVEGREAHSSPESYDVETASRLWHVSEGLVGQTFEYSTVVSQR